MVDELNTDDQIDDEQGKGIPCPDCGCRRNEVWRTTPVMKRIRRERVCQNCGRKYYTFEEIPK